MTRSRAPAGGTPRSVVPTAALPDAVRVRVTVSDFFTGLFAALRLRGQTAFSIRGDRFDAVIKDLYDNLVQRAGDDNLDLRFRIHPHRMYGDSQTVRRALNGAAKRRIISFDNPEYLDIRIQLDDVDADRKLDRLQIPRQLFDELADQFLHEYRERR